MTDTGKTLLAIISIMFGIVIALNFIPTIGDSVYLSKCTAPSVNASGVAISNTCQTNLSGGGASLMGIVLLIAVAVILIITVFAIAKNFKK